VRDPRLGGDDDTVARDALDRLTDDRLTDDRLRALSRGGVEEIDAHVRCLTDEDDGFRLAFAGAEPQPSPAVPPGCWTRVSEGAARRRHVKSGRTAAAALRGVSRVMPKYAKCLANRSET